MSVKGWSVTRHQSLLIGWSMGSNCREEPTIAAPDGDQGAQAQRGLLHHTDRGAHYTSAKYQAILASHGMHCSMSRIANCLDNAVAESFFSTLENEQTLHERYRTRADARAAIFEFIGLFYSPVRQHSHLSGLSPMQFERRRARVNHVPVKGWSAHPAPIVRMGTDRAHGHRSCA